MNEVKNLFNEDDELLFAELDRDQVKYTRENVIFITRDETGQIIWLETGNTIVGLTHILRRHANEFKESLKVEADQIPEYLKKVVTFGVVTSSTTGMRNGRLCVERIYLYDDEYHILTALGTNGFLVSAHPEGEKTTEKRERRKRHET